MTDTRSAKKKKTRDFKASHFWVTTFKKRFGFRFRKPSKPDVTSNRLRHAQEKAYLKLCQEWLWRVGPELMFNMDETSFTVYREIMKCWCDKDIEFDTQKVADGKTGQYARHSFLQRLARKQVGEDIAERLARET